MTDKELHKLGRRELLQLMLAQGREAEKAKQELAETQDKLHRLEESYERLKGRLDDKDAQIHKLRAALQSANTDTGAIAGAAHTAMPAPDDYYAPPPPQAPPSTPQPPAPPVQQPIRAVPQPPMRHAEAGYAPPAKPEAPAVPPAVPPAAPKHARREQEYYDYLFGPVTSQNQPAPQPQRERPRPQSQPPPQPPVRNPQPAPPQQPRMQSSQWSPPQQYMREPQRSYYNAPPQYRPPPYGYDREPPPPPPPPEPEPYYPVQTADEFIPEPDRPPENMQMLNAVEIVNGRPVSQNQVLRPRR